MARNNKSELRAQARAERMLKEHLHFCAREEGRRIQQAYQQFERENPDFVEYTSQQLHQQAEKLYIQAQNKKRIRNAAKKSKRLMNALVVMIAVISVAVLAAASTVEAVRALVYNVVVEMDDQYAYVGVSDGKIETENWEQRYAPQYLPGNYTLVREEFTDELKSLDYEVTSPQDMYIGLDERIGEIDYCYALGAPPDIAFVDINGYAGFLSFNGNSCSLSWATEDRFFLLTTVGIPRGEVLKIARSVQPADW